MMAISTSRMTERLSTLQDATGADLARAQASPIKSATALAASRDLDAIEAHGRMRVKLRRLVGMLSLTLAGGYVTRVFTVAVVVGLVIVVWLVAIGLGMGVSDTTVL